MGIETSPLDVEESTEPPICPCTKDSTQPLTTVPSNLSTGSGTERTEKRPVEPTLQPLPKDHSRPSTEPQSQPSGNLSEYAHTLGLGELASVLHAELQYVSHFVQYNLNLPLLTSIEMGSQPPKLPPVSIEMGRTGSERWKAYPFGRSC